MDSQNTMTLSVLFFPLMAPGHMLPMLDMAKLFALRGVDTTFLTTPANAPLVQPLLVGSSIGHLIRIHLVPFPSDTGLTDGCENLSSVPTWELNLAFFAALPKLRVPFSRALQELRPDCVVTDAFLPWTYAAAAELGIPRLVFHGVSFFALCAMQSLRRYKPETRVLPGLPHRIEMPGSQIDGLAKRAAGEFFGRVDASESKSYGVVVNSFYELEPDYARHYRSVIGRRAWHIGPLALCNKPDDVDRDGCLQWLDKQRSGSVVYICFGSLGKFGVAQHRELALGLEASGHPFVWVARKDGSEGIPDGFEERVEGRGMVVKGWVPQVLILNHPSVGGFVTHCGWNSSLEGVSAGLPMVTWPMFAEQLYNERLIVDVLKIGVSVGVKEYVERPDEMGLVEAAEIRTAVEEVMGGEEEAVGRRKRARELGETARNAVEIGGSSYDEMSKLIQELTERKIMDAVQAHEKKHM